MADSLPNTPKKPTPVFLGIRCCKCGKLSEVVSRSCETCFHPTCPRCKPEVKHG